ncbi:hypothetical protein CQ020_17230 [Arthrobacter sp. MYb23]|nr:hypothetical protein CQ038_07745 [Arthrobacter sp. MYb51]PRB93755.1 hypothetical protein CQ020_17230 [Arthrobacter sp. MYb23]
MHVLKGSETKLLGITKIARRGMISEGTWAPTRYTDVPPVFEDLGPEYFSLGTDADFYRVIVDEFGSARATTILQSLRDLASLPNLLDDALKEMAVQKSLFRYITVPTVQDQFATILSGELGKSRFSISYILRPEDESSPRMTFTVDPDKKLPSNVHAVIGANGTGKTTALRNIRWALDDSDDKLHKSEHVVLSDRDRIAGLVSVSFSPFEVFPVKNRNDLDQARFRVTNVGLSAITARPTTDTEEEWRAQSYAQNKEYRALIKGCATDRASRLVEAMRYLAQADAVLEQHGIEDLDALHDLDFSALSSGHKIVMLTLASLVCYCEEKTLVLIDEPESFLHPPLLGAFTRALSWLMTETNGLAIIATHSPVVLQEVPKRCAWKVWSVGALSEVSAVEIETFGENLGLLTREIFGLELDKSGYHALLRDTAKKSRSYEDALDTLGGELGEEAKLLLRSLVRRNGRMSL